MDLVPQPGKEYSLYEIMYMNDYARTLCQSLLKAEDTPLDIRIVARQLCDYSENIKGAMIYLRPTQLKEYCQRFEAYTRQLAALIERETR